MGGNDSADCLSPSTPCQTINGAIGKASGGDSVFVASGTYVGTGTQVILIDRDLAFSGGWDAPFGLQEGMSVIDGQSARRGIAVSVGGVTASIERFVVQNGIVGLGPLGGGIRNDGQLALDQVTVRDNSGGGIAGGDLIITSSTISGNVANTGAGISLEIGSELILTNSTVSGNHATSEGGGIEVGSGVATLRNVTVTNNSADFRAGGVRNATSGTLTMQNSIIAGNSAPFSQDCYVISTATTISLGHNLGTCGASGIGDISAQDPRLGPLQDNGGPTRTHELMPFSPAIDTGNPATPGSGGSACEALDQRGVLRSIDGTADGVSTCDIGAFEAGTPYIADGSFELGSPNPFWGEFSTVFGTPLCTVTLCGAGTGTGPRTGSWWTWFGGVDVFEEGLVEQEIIIPAWGPTLRFWLEIPASAGMGNDSMQVLIDGSPLFSVSDLDWSSYLPYAQVNLDVSAYGDCKPHTLRFYSQTHGLGPTSSVTNFFVDDVMLGLGSTTSFCDLPASYWALDFIEAILDAGLTAGYPDGTYRPANPVTRAEMAVFIKKGIHGSTYMPPAPDGSHPFSDIAGHWAEAWMEDLYDEGMTSGYPDGTYRPANNVSRAEMAVFLLKAKHGASYTPPPPDGGSFSDVNGHWAEAWIEQLAEEGITSGYPDGTFRPQNNVTRAEMAVFLVNAFGLALP